MIHSFLLIGQSNAAGRGFAEETAPLDNLGGRLKILRNGLWAKMFRPINPDRSFAGVSFAESFATAYATAHEGVDVGIIPCADGGTAISQWMPGEILFDNAVHCAKMAMRKSDLKGILWHQGESDANPQKYPLYKEKFTTMMNALKEALGCPDLPVVIGGLGDYLGACENFPEIARNYHHVNEILTDLGKTYPNCAFAPATGLDSNPDKLHFSAAAQIEFGIRYYKAYETLAPKAEAPHQEAPTPTTERSAIELL